jgi:hypothetical protein
LKVKYKIIILLTLLAVAFFTFSNNEVVLKDQKAIFAVNQLLLKEFKMQLPSDSILSASHKYDSGSAFSHAASNFYLVDILLDGEKIAKKLDEFTKSLTLIDPNKGVEGVFFYSYISDKKPFCRALERRQFEKVICNSISTKQFFKTLEYTSDSATYILFTAIKDTKYFWLRIWSYENTGF